MIRFKIALLSLLLLLGVEGFAQYTPPVIEKSTQKEIVAGVEYFVHRVKAKETLYSISKAYECGIEQIIADNPSLSEGLKEGAALYIRVIKSDKPATPITVHKVKWYETLKSIATKYGVTQESIVAFNKLKESVVKARDLIKIPPFDWGVTATNQKREEVATTASPSDSVATTIKKGESTKSSLLDRVERALNPKNRYSTIVAKLLLPMESKELLSEEWNREESNSFIEFYQGFLTALIDLKKRYPTLKLDLEVIDTDATSVDEIIRSGKLDPAHIIIGPVYREELIKVVNYTRGKGQFVVSPLDPNCTELAHNNPRFFQVNTPQFFQQQGVIKKLATSANIVLIYEKGVLSPATLIDESREALIERGLRYKELSYTITEGRAIGNNMGQLLSENSLNQVIIASENEAFVSDVLRNLNLISSAKKLDISIFGTPRWRTFENVDIVHYHNMNLSLALQYNVDYNNHNVSLFLESYRSLFLSEPSPYSFQGYDIAIYFLGNMWKVGALFLESSEKYREELLQSGFNFIRTSPEGGYINSAVRVINYAPNFSITMDSNR